MRFLLDIDGTIAERNPQCFMRLFNRKVGLGIDEKKLSSLAYQDFLILPEVVGYRERVGEKRFRWLICLIGLDPQHQLRMLPIQGAVEATRKLAELGHVAYYTARKTTFSEPLNRQMVRATQRWLTDYGFPCPEEVVFCVSPQEKLCRIAELIKETGQQVVLIDDLYTSLLKDLALLNASLHEVLQASLTLWAFRACNLADPHPSIRVLALPAWEDLEQVCSICIEREENSNHERYHGTGQRW